ncbi:esterase EstB [Verrucomicrobiota bacterium]|jgi:CubicO group peptidase (beta-lactamase class C family)|nr:esterase EstB [Verrucomicrobiota bacterium]
MRRHALLPLTCFVLALLASGCTQPAPREEISLDESNAVFSFALQELQEKQEFAGAVTMVVGPNRIIALEAFGLADIASGRPMRKDSVFWIASMTKPITAMGVLMLVEEGKVGLDEPVEKYLPSFKGQKVATPTGPVPAPRPVTVRDLLTHTSGLSAASLTAANQPVDTIPLAAMVDHSGRTPLISAPGAKWAYSNTGINALGRIIEVVSGQPYADFVQKRFFDPLDMNSTSFWPDDTLQASLATPYRKDKATGKLIPAGNSRFSNPLENRARTALPAGGLFSTANDLAQLYQMILRGGELDGHRFLRPETLKLMTTNQLGEMPKVSFAEGMRMGLGFHVVGTPVGVTESLSPGSFGHGGAYGTQAWIDPVRRQAYVLLIQRTDLANSDGSEIRREFQKTAVEAFK